MKLYYLVFAISLIYLVMPVRIRRSPWALAAFLLYIAVFIGLGDMIGGYDRYIYGEVFDAIADEIRGKQHYQSLFFLVDGIEYGYFFWQVLVSQVTANRYIYFLITTIMIYGLYFRAIRNYVTDYPMACIVFLGIYYYFTMTYIRQVIAVVIIWQSIPYIWERKKWKFIATVLLASSFHNSALIFLPVYFIPLKKYPKFKVISIFVLCLFLGLSPLPQMVLAGAEDTTGKEGYSAGQTSGFRWEYVLEVIVFLWILLQNYQRIPNDRKSITFMNIAFSFCAILLFFIRFGQGGRFGWYFMIGLIYMLSELSTYSRQYRYSYQRMRIITLALCAVLFMRMTTGWSFNLAPYKTFLTNGQPSGAYYIYQRYEYDKNYTYDKLYR